MSCADDAGAIEVRVAQSDARARRSCGRRARRRSPRWAGSRRSYYVQDGVIPRTPPGGGASTDRRARRAVRTAGRERVPRRRRQPPPARLLRLGTRPARQPRAQELAGEIIAACVDAGGSITGEHGVGVDKKAFMPSMFNAGRPRRLPPPALRLRSARPRQSRQGDADPAPVRRGSGAHREHPLERDSGRDAALTRSR